MPVVTCSECNGKVSPAASACPHCGHPMALAYASPAPAPAPRSVQTIQQTGKIWKIQQLISGLLCVVGIAAVAIGMNEKKDSGAAAIGAVSLVVGLGWFIFARIGAWWCHG